MLTDGKTWIKVDGNNATIGLNPKSATQVQEFVFVKLPEKGQIKKGDEYITLEAVKWSGHLTSPVSGTVVDVNQEIFNDPSLLNKDPLANWIMKVEITDDSELEGLDKLESE